MEGIWKLVNNYVGEGGARWTLKPLYIFFRREIFLEYTLLLQLNCLYSYCLKKLRVRNIRTLYFLLIFFKVLLRTPSCPVREV